ncbi:PREDICTED: agamous-like MADS-box protein AGL75 [Camelina sativa]|uniref:Agamous-like MADS-box protein AGL75 n=1 Tax=Camelina sativa TaxID=90675 RepID=A0ABM0X4K5_CAMSA|nr:PREDICTED: agamous-like MADS-box protein AGL75 [Camelina sativa]
MRLPSSSSSSYSLASTSLRSRLETIFRKAKQLSILCQVDVCVIYYGPDGDLKTFPNDKEKVRNMAMRYSRLNDSLRRKKSFNISEFLEGEKDNPNKRRKTSPSPSPKNVDVLIDSLELKISTFQERVRYLVSQEKHKLLDHHHQSLASSTPSSSSSSLTNRSLNPSQQFSLLVYNHGDNTLSQIPLSASNLNHQDFSALFQESLLKNEQNMY